MTSNDQNILDTALCAEASFTEKISRLTDLCSDENISAELFCYQKGLKDLKEDFLLPALLKTEERNQKNDYSLFEEKYHYYQKT